MTQDVQDVSEMDRLPLGDLAERLYKFLWWEYGSLRWDQYFVLKNFLKELCKSAIFFDEQSEGTKDILNKLLKKSERDE